VQRDVIGIERRMLRLENVSVDIAGAPVLRGVSGGAAGWRVALIGRNGAGKTTTLRR
jgi:ABC-type branched-subunit amino acid transport system ATPase component